MNVASPKVGMKRSEMSVSSLRYDILSNPSEENFVSPIPFVFDTEI